MPSANPKLEKQASLEAVEPIRQAIIVIEHRIRNLEKRKGKLESYRSIVKNGGELNADQKQAVEKFDEVLQTLEVSRELHKQIVSIANESAKQQKKLARKEALERLQQDVSKVKEVLLVQNILLNMNSKSVQKDFLSGKNGAILLSQEELKYLDEIYDEVIAKPQSSDSNVPFSQQVQKVAEHYVAIVDGKQREVVGTTYQKVKEILGVIADCGYFEQSSNICSESKEIKKTAEQINEINLSNDTSETSINNQDCQSYASNERHIAPSESLLPMPNFVAHSPIHPVSSVSTSGIDHVSSSTGQTSVSNMSVANAEPSFYANPNCYSSHTQSPSLSQNQQPISMQAPKLNDVIGTNSSSFFFLQESELDAPETNSLSQQSLASNITASVNAPIASQTFTNQSFVGSPVVPNQVIYQHQHQQELSHISKSFSNANPPPPIPMPPSHQSNLQISSQSTPSFQQQQVSTQNFENSSIQQEANLMLPEHTQNKLEQALQEIHSSGSGDVAVNIGQVNESNEWASVSDESGEKWTQDQMQSTIQESNLQNSQLAWDEQQRNSTLKTRGSRRGNANGYGGRGRGNYQQINRASYYRNDNNYQNGYQRNNWSNSEGGNVFSVGYKRNSISRGMSRGERGNMDRGRVPFRGSQRANNRGNYAARSKV